ncbi:CdaR family transcriptional regulator [Arthrobacter sp. JZ12]|uniref:PucR family transcriptional regulator n=1 Tax=Arthrobacter sp. JZ12 TaxID=2654190 RepID=UPI002B4A4F8F|nr:PucR family transcriptional regulator ligand-binding domain-containing protein [Arthrobacter sp. JZ12]WRH24217.1 CdaR family transcriptional regulator [Arthrobacter sp. JZ12]
MTRDVLRVEDLVSTASLDIRVLAGSSGLRRDLLWAHSCEMEDPTIYLGPHELLMTIGLCVPKDPSEQAAFVARLDEAGLSGLMIGDHDPAPPLSPEMFSEADRRDFPILLAGVNTAYAVVARHVAAANWSTESLQVLKLSKLYHVATYAEKDLTSLLREVVPSLRAGLSIVDTVTGITLASVAHTEDASTEVRRRRYQLRGNHPAELVVAEYPGEEVGSFLLVHLTKMLEVATDAVLAAADRRGELAERLLAGLLNGSATEETREFLAPHVPSNGFRLAALPRGRVAAVGRAVALAAMPVLLGTGREHGLALVPVEELAGFRELVEQLGVQVGVSSVFYDYVDTRTAAVEAGKVLTAAEHTDAPWTEFEGSTLSVLTRSQRESAEIVTGVLGPLASDSPRIALLRETLFCYLRNDRKWNETAAELGIHRQTLSYRLKRISEETGRDLNRTPDLAALWVAFQAWENMHGTGTS